MSNHRLDEDEGVVAGGDASPSSNTTDGVENPVLPMHKVKRRKDKDDTDLQEMIFNHIVETASRLIEEVIAPNAKKGLNKMRHGMPQLTNFDAFKDDLKANGVKMSEPTELDPKQLNPTQSNFNEDKIKHMVETGDWKNKPILVSSDDYVLDGHHRWLAAVELREKVRARRIDMSIEDLLKFLKDKPYIEKKTLTQ